MVTKPTHRKVRDVWGTRIVLGTRLKLLDRPIGRYYDRIQVCSNRQAGISCRVAEGRALGRHGNRIGIIYLHRRCQLSPGNGDHEIRVRENLIRTSRASFPIF